MGTTTPLLDRTRSAKLSVTGPLLQTVKEDSPLSEVVVSCTLGTGGSEHSEVLGWLQISYSFLTFRFMSFSIKIFFSWKT